MFVDHASGGGFEGRSQGSGRLGHIVVDDRVRAPAICNGRSTCAIRKKSCDWRV